MPFLSGIKGLAEGLSSGLESRQKEGATQRESAYKHLLAKQLKGVPQALAPETAAYKTAQTEDIQVKQRQAAIDAKKKEFKAISDAWTDTIEPTTGKAKIGREGDNVVKKALAYNTFAEFYKPGGKLFGKKGETPAQDNFHRKMEAWIADPTNDKKGLAVYSAQAMLEKGTPKSEFPEGFQESLQNAADAIKGGADPFQTYQKMAIAFPKQSAELKRILIQSQKLGDVDLSNALWGE